MTPYSVTIPQLVVMIMHAKTSPHSIYLKRIYPELLSYRKPKGVVQKVKHGHKNRNNNHYYHDKNHDEIEVYQQ